MGLYIFLVLVAVGFAALFGVDWLNSERQKRRLNNAAGRDDIDEFKVRNDKIINADFSSFSAKSVGDERRHG